MTVLSDDKSYESFEGPLPIEFHMAIEFDFNTREWVQSNFLGSKLVAKENWVVDKKYFEKYPVLKDSYGIYTLISMTN